jgi:hypothetical protein
VCGISLAALGSAVAEKASRRAVAHRVTRSGPAAGWQPVCVVEASAASASALLECCVYSTGYLAHWVLASQQLAYCAEELTLWA